MNRPGQEPLATVPMGPSDAVHLAQQAGERRARWAWCEAQVWTNRMLKALEESDKGGPWFRLIDKVYAPGNLEAAWKKVQANNGAAGVDGQTVQAFEAHAEKHLLQLAQEIQDQHYRPLDVRRHWIPKPGSNEKRPLGIPAVRDRVVQTALRSVLEPIFEREFAEHSYGFRPGRSAKQALAHVDQKLKEGYTWIVDADLKSYFDTIPHDKLLERVRERVTDGRVLQLLKAYLKANVLDGLQRWEPETGSPQGAVISPLLSNIYLNPLDQEMAQTGYEMVRYADDFVVLCRSEEEAQGALERVRNWTAQAGLTLHPEKTRIVDCSPETEGSFEFLGFYFWRGYKGPRGKSLEKIKETIREKTPRCNGQSLRAIILHLNRSLRGWFNYFRSSAKTPMRMLDGMVRRRLRSILEKRHKKKGHGHGLAKRKWPNAYFADQGLFSLLEAWTEYRQSLRGTH